MRIGAYETVSELGRGGMGIVYRARSKDGADVALKLLVSASPEALSRFERESRLLELLSKKEGFVPLLDRGVSPQGAFLIMPLLEGGTLQERLRRGPLGIEEARALGERLASTLGKAHARGIVHRDLKPANVLFDRDGQAFVADLGLAKHFRHDLPGASQSRSLTHAGSGAGTIGYIAPEQLNDAKTVGPQADVFALGAILHECLSGERAFAGRGLLEYVSSVESGRAPDLQTVRDEVPAGLAAAVARAISREPADRFEGGETFAVALRLCAGETRRGKHGLVIAGAVLALVGTGGGLAAWAFSSEGETHGLASPTPEPEDRPRAIQALLAQAESRLAAQDYDKALALCSRAIELDPGRSATWAARGAACFKKGDWDGAIADCNRAIELDRKNAIAWGNRGAARTGKNDLEGALSDFTKATELDPTYALAWVSRGTLRMRKGDVEGAITDLSRGIELDPKHLPGWLNRAAARCSRDELDLAMSDLTRALEIDPRNVGALANRGFLHAQRGDWTGAIEDSSRALELDAKAALALRTRGRACEQRGDPLGAIADLRRFLELAPDDPSAQDASVELARLVAANPGDDAEIRDADGFVRRGAIRIDGKDVDGALLDFTRALELDPKLASAWTTRGGARILKRDYARAYADTTRAIELDPGTAQAWEIRASARGNQGDQDGAIQDCDRSLELDPNRVGAWALRGGACQNKSDFKGAERSYSRALQLMPQFTSAWFGRGMARLSLGDRDGARSDLEHFLEIVPPNHENAARARAALESLK